MCPVSLWFISSAACGVQLKRQKQMRLLYVFCWYILVFDVLFEIFLKEFRWSLSATLIKFLEDTSNITYSRSAGFKINLRSRPTHPVGCGTTLTHEGRLKRRPLEQLWMRSLTVLQFTNVMLSLSLQDGFHHACFWALRFFCGALERTLKRINAWDITTCWTKVASAFNRWCHDSCIVFSFSWMSMFTDMSTHLVFAVLATSARCLLALRVGIA